MLVKAVGWLISIVSGLISLYGVSQLVVGFQAMGSSDAAEGLAGVLTFAFGFFILLVGGVFLLSGVWLIKKSQ